MNHLRVNTEYIRSNKSNSSFNKNLLIDKFNINIDKHYVVQGCTYFKEYILISAYNEDRHFKSRIYVVKNNVIIHSCKLDTNAHVGGISIDNEHNNLWCTDKSGTISAYRLNDILSMDEVNSIYKRIYVGDGLINVYGNNAVAYLTIYNNKIYLGNFNNKEKSIIKIFNILDDGSINKDKYNVIKGNAFTQGLYINDNYIVTSCSWGPLNKSKLNVYNYVDGEFVNEFHKTYKMPCMMEQICIKDNKLITAYESNTVKFRLNLYAKDIRIFSIDKNF